MSTSSQHSQTIEETHNFGPVTTMWLREVGIVTLGSLIELGWQEVLALTCARFPQALNLNFAYALIGAELGCDWREIPESDREAARQLVKRMRSKAS